MLPIITIVGRPNVGKSSLLNAMARSRISIVDPMPGVTRDRVSVRLRVGERAFELVDTGGIGIVDAQQLEAHVEEQIQTAIHSADYILFMVDVRDGLTALDRRVGEELRKINRPTIVLANKADVRKFEDQTGEFYTLGFETVLPVSAQEGRNLDDLWEMIEGWLMERPVEEANPDEVGGAVMKLAIVGKRNAGKSTLVNALAQEDRVIVSELPGTTRDSVDVRFRFRDMDFIAIDTAGVRRQRAVDNSVEFYSQSRSLRAVRRADVVILLVEAQADISQVDKGLMDAIVTEAKPVLVGINKWDTVDNATTDDFRKYVEAKLPALTFAPISFLSAKTGSNVWQTISLAYDLFQQAATRVGTSAINTVLRAAVERRSPPLSHGRRPRLFYATQVDVRPPTIVIFVNDPDWFDANYRRYLVNRFHEELPFKEVPIKLIFRARQKVVLPAEG